MNLPKFDLTKSRLNFLIFNTKSTFNRLWLAFIKV